MLLNLISNSINYSPGGGTIAISATAEEGMMILSVTDPGMGIPAADLARVFTPFEKIHDQKTRRRSGAGLGLALVKSIAELHGGTVALSSVEGQGTTVTLRMPTQGVLTPPAAEG
jgi:signal transduction histidine kinase